MKSVSILICIIWVSFSAGTATAGWLGGITLEKGEQAGFGHGEQARLDVHIKVTNANGARITMTPYLDGNLPPVSWSSGGSPLLADGAVENRTLYVAFGSGEVVIDEFHLKMWDPVTTETLLETSVSVDYRWSDTVINDVELNFTSPSWLLRGTDLVVGFDYLIADPGGVYLDVQPLTGGTPTSGYVSTSGSPLTYGGYTTTRSFTFNSVNPHVDAVRLTMWNSDYSALLYETILPVDLTWGDHSVSNVEFDFSSGSAMPHDLQIPVEFDYATTDFFGCSLRVRVLNESMVTIPGQSSSASTFLLESGHIRKNFTMLSGAGEGAIRYLEIRMFDAYNFFELESFIVPVEYDYSPHAIYDLSYYPGTPAVLDLNENVIVYSAFQSPHPFPVKMYSWPWSAGSLITDWSVGTTATHFYSGQTTAIFSKTDQPGPVDQVRMVITETPGGYEVYERLFPVDFVFGDVSGVAPVPDAPLDGMILGQNYPNPFNPVTSIPVDLAVADRVTLKVFDLRGRLVWADRRRELPSGRSVIAFDGTGLASGTYFYALESGLGGQTRHMVLLK